MFIVTKHLRAPSGALTLPYGKRDFLLMQNLLQYVNNYDTHVRIMVDSYQNLQNRSIKKNQEIYFQEIKQRRRGEINLCRLLKSNGGTCLFYQKFSFDTWFAVEDLTATTMITRPQGYGGSQSQSEFGVRKCV